MKAEIARARLAAAPVEVRERMLHARAELPAGAITVTNRFFTILAERGEHVSAPASDTFEKACQSESTLALLLRVLSKYAPEVCLADGRELRRAYYRQRGAGDDRGRADDNGKRKPRGDKSRTQPRTWPNQWLDLLPGLLAAPVTDSSIDRHVASINRCAAMLPHLVCPPRLGWLLAWELGRALQEHSERGTNLTTAANYIGSLVSLGLHGGLDTDALNGMRSVQAHLQRGGRRVVKRKQSRIEGLHARGGYKEVVRVIAAKLDEALGLPDWTAEAANARAAAAILAVNVNIPSRTGDVSSWVLGEQLTREAWGEWKLRWRQGKTGVWQDAGPLWSEIGQVLDEHILGGRPQRHAARRFEELRGCNWLSLAPEGYATKWPSQKVSETLGVPLHDLRTLAADYLRLHDPASAPDIIAALLGHSSKEAGEEYSVLCADTVAQREWLTVRKGHMVDRTI